MDGLMGWLTRLLSPRAGGSAARTSAARTRNRTARPGGKPSPPNAVYSVRRRVIVSLRHGWKRKTTRKVTKEWRHGNCPVRHQTRRAAVRCRNS